MFFDTAKVLIYQLFGRAAEKPDGSLVLTVGDQLEYVDSVQGVGKETRLPASLRSAMQDCEAFLFVGFDFENWYLKVLFHILKFSEKAKLVFGLPDGRSLQMAAATAAFFENQYKFSFVADRPADLLEGLQKRIDAGAAGQSASDSATRTLLFLHSKSEKDEAVRERIDKHLASAKRAFGLRSESILDFETGEDAAVKAEKVASASVIVALLSVDFLNDDGLLDLAEMALARPASEVIVAAIYAREAVGTTDIFKGRADIYPAETIPLSWMHEDEGPKKVAEMLEKLIQANLKS